MKSLKARVITASIVGILLVAGAVVATGNTRWALKMVMAPPIPFGASVAPEASIAMKQMTKDFWQALSEDDYKKVGNLSPYPLSEKNHCYSGLAIVKIGEPYKSFNGYAGFYVPYEIRLKDGYIKKWQLAIRNDNPAKSYRVDGGF